MLGRVCKRKCRLEAVSDVLIKGTHCKKGKKQLVCVVNYSRCIFCHCILLLSLVRALKRIYTCFGYVPGVINNTTNAYFYFYNNTATTAATTTIRITFITTRKSKLHFFFYYLPRSIDNHHHLGNRF